MNGKRPADPESALIVYDGECIFCQNYVRLLRLRGSIGQVELIDARSADPRVSALQREGYDLDQGMIFVHAGRTYHGAEAVNALALLTSDSNVFNRLSARVLSSPRRAAALYPLLKAGRRLTLLLRGRKLIAQGRATPSRAAPPQSPP